MNILLKDNRYKLMQEMLDLREETELLISGNINILNRNGADLNIESFTGTETKYWLEKGFEIDQGLYDRLIIEHNNQKDVELLTRWK
jgi:hypothetical protein